MICKICECNECMDNWNICRQCARNVIYFYEEEEK